MHKILIVDGMRKIKNKGNIAVLFCVTLILFTILVYNVCFDLDIQKSPISHIPNSENAELRKYNVGIIVQKTTLGDKEIAQRYKIAAEQLGWNAYVFKYKASMGRYWLPAQIVKYIISFINFFSPPDFFIVIYPSYHQILPSDSPKFLAIYGNLDEEVKRIVSEYEKGSSGFISDYQFVGDYDGYIDVNKNSNWTNKNNIDILSRGKNNTNKIVINAYPSTFSADFSQLNYHELFYCGGNWDAFRSSDHFKSIILGLDHKGYLNIYGPENAWQFVSAYRGYMPDDGYSVIRKIQESGIALVVHSQFHNDNGIPSGRIFEAAAAGAVIISDHNPFVKKNFGQCVNFVDFNDKPDKVVERIDHFVKWAQDNPKLARRQAACAHKIFEDKFTLESVLLEISNHFSVARE